MAVGVDMTHAFMGIALTLLGTIMAMVIGLIVALILGSGKEGKEDITIGQLLKKLILEQEKQGE